MYDLEASSLHRASGGPSAERMRIQTGGLNDRRGGHDGDVISSLMCKTSSLGCRHVFPRD